MPHHIVRPDGIIHRSHVDQIRDSGILGADPVLEEAGMCVQPDSAEIVDTPAASVKMPQVIT